MLLVVAARSEELPQDHPLRHLDAQAHLRLGPFSPAEIRQLAESMAGPLPDEAIDVVRELSGGSPFMASAVLYGLFESARWSPTDTVGASNRWPSPTCSRRAKPARS